MSYSQNFATAISRLSAAFVSGNARTTFGRDRLDLPKILQACLESLLAHHVVRLRLALIPGHGYQRPRAHVVEILVGYGESLRQIRPGCRTQSDAD